MKTEHWILIILSLLPVFAFSSESSLLKWVTQSQSFKPQCEKFQAQVKQVSSQTPVSQLINLLESYPGIPEPTLKIRRLFTDVSTTKNNPAVLWQAFDCRASVSFLSLIRKLSDLDQRTLFSPEIKKQIGAAILAKSPTGPTLLLDTLIERAIIEVAIQHQWITAHDDITYYLRELKTQLDQTKKNITALYGNTSQDEKKSYGELSPDRQRHVVQGMLYELKAAEEGNEKLRSLLI